MNNAVQIFNNPDFGQIRTLTIKGEPWFAGKDVAVALGYENHRDALRKHVEDEDKGASQIATPSGTQQMTIINESGLYALIFSSKLESAKNFKRWVTHEVLPTLRKTGRYEIQNNEKHYQPTRPLTSDDYIDAARTIAKCHNSRLPIVLDLVELLNQYSLNELVKKLGLCKSSIYYYRIGKHKPRGERRQMIIEVLTKEGEYH